VDEASGPVTADPAKFGNYAFESPKAAIFESYGYSAADSEELASAFEEQAAEKIEAGEFTVGTSDQYGQRITVDVKLEGQGDAEGRSTVIKTGWIIEPDGSVRLVTPFTGFVK
jgi:filamentous hemagglutinin